MASSIVAYLLQAVTNLIRLVGAVTVVALLAAAPAAAQEAGVAICHYTGDPNSPYQEIRPAAEAVIDHLAHPDDIVPAPPGGCPAEYVPPEPEESPEPDYALPTPTATPPPAARPRPRPRRRPRRDRAELKPTTPASGVGGAGASATATRALQVEETTELPMTGSWVPGVAMFGVGFLLAGSGLRLRLRAAARYDW